MLATVAAARAYLGLTSTAQDALLASLIARASGAIEAYCGRRFGAVAAYARRTVDGTGSATLILPGGQPVIGVTYLAIDGVEVRAAASSADEGYIADDMGVFLTAARFPFRRRCVVCSWTAGETASQAGIVPATPHTITPTTDGWAAADLGVAYATHNGGAALALVAAAPGEGQYAFAEGVYTFAAADAGRAVVMTYAPVPAAIEAIALEMAGGALKRRERLGVTSKSLAGESISYSQDVLSSEQMAVLGPFRSMVPA